MQSQRKSLIFPACDTYFYNTQLCSDPLPDSHTLQTVGVTFMFPNFIFSHPKNSSQWANVLGRRCPPGWQHCWQPSPGAEHGASRGSGEFCRSSAQQGGSARQCHLLCLAGVPEPEPDILDSWTQSPQLVLGPCPSPIKRDRW